MSNVEVACDARETAMRIQHDEDRIKRFEATIVIITHYFNSYY